MRLSRRAILLGVAMAGLALAPGALAATASAATGRDVTLAAGHCIRVTATIPLRSASGGIAVNPRTSTVYAAGFHLVFVIREQTDTVVAAIPVGRGASAVAVNPKTNTIYVTNNRDAT